MNSVSMNNLLTYLEGLSLTASNRKWLADKLVEPRREAVMSAEEVKADMKEAFQQLKEVKEGKRTTRNAEALLYEL